MTTASRRVTHRLAPALILAALAAGGCGPTLYPVTGRVVYDDGKPLTEGSVVGETTIDGKKVSVQGEVKPDGTFTWGTSKAENGARPGKYRVLVAPRALGDAELAEGKIPAVDAKFASHDTSGIEFEVKPGPNDLKITVSKPQPKADPEPQPDATKDTDPRKDADPKKEADLKKSPDGKSETPPDPKKEADPKKDAAK